MFPLPRRLAVAFLALLLSAASFADVRLPAIVSDGMVLQREAPLRIWGWAEPGEAVSVAFRKQQLATTTDADGHWSVQLAPLTAGGPDTMEIKGTNEIILRDILVGDVWVASGQSNMTHTFVRWQERYAAEIAASTNPAIRQFHVPTHPELNGPIEDLPGIRWVSANPENLLDFAVVGYFFALQLHEHSDVPQGIIMTCVGGTPIEAWTSEAGFREFPEQLAIIAHNQDEAYVAQVNAEAAADRAAAPPRGEADQGLAGPLPWSDPAYVPLNWKPINIPGFWEQQGLRDLDGIVWYRRELELPAALAGVEAQVKLGRIRDADELYVNGQLVGRTSYQYPQREYTIPAGVLQAGSNLLVIRVTNQKDDGGFLFDKPYRLTAAGQTFDLKGTWHYRVGEAFPPLPRMRPGIGAQNQPTALFNGMIAPYTNYAIRGALWYQGETNAGNPKPYRALLTNLIADWRAQWGQPDLPFFIAQLPNYMAVDYLPADSGWALMREAQLETALADPNVGLGINIELGEWNDIHPGNKKPVGERLALLARAMVYGETGFESSGPLFRDQTIEGQHIRLTFDHVGGGLVITNGEPTLGHFAIAGADGHFVWAQARIESPDTVVVWSDAVPEPRFVRYAWASNPDFANLGNDAGLPASPFRTDRNE